MLNNDLLEFVKTLHIAIEKLNSQETINYISLVLDGLNKWGTKL